MKELVSQEYKIWLESLKNKFRSSQIKASIKVNTTLLEFYWDLGGQIVQKQEEHKRRSGFLEKLSHDLSAEFPDVKGFSYRNIDEAIYYVQNTMLNGISRSVLVHQIESNLYEREGKAITNFENTLPPIQSDLANKYNFKISKQEKIMFEKWNQEDPIS